MKKLLLIVFLLLAGPTFASEPVTQVVGPADALGTGGGDAATLNGEPGSFYLNYSSHSGNIKKGNIPNWSSVVCEVTECNGVHTHAYGVAACEISFKSVSTVQMAGGCTVHLNGGTEYNFDPGTFTNINPNFVSSSVWVGIDSSGIVEQSGEFTNAQRLSVAPLVRLQSKGTGDQIISTLMDVRFKSSSFDWRFQNWVRDFIGALAGSGLETAEVGTRNLALSGGTFSDTEIDGHTTGAFSAITGILIHSTAFSPVTTVEGLFQADNLQYDTGSGLATMTNNNWYASHNLAMSTAGGIVNGVDTGRSPTFLLIMSKGQWNSLGEALEQPFNLGPFVGAKDVIRLSRLIVQRNSAGITRIVQVQPFNTSGSGTGVAGTSSLQEVYNNSPNGGTPEITTNPTNNSVEFRYGGNDGEIFKLSKADGTPVFRCFTSGCVGGGIIKQFAFVNTSSFFSTTATFNPILDIRPTLTTGAKFISKEMTGLTPGNDLSINFASQAFCSAAGNTMNVFANISGVTVVAARGEFCDNAGDVSEPLLIDTAYPITSTEHTVEIRVSVTAGTLSINGTGSRWLGGAASAPLTIMEVVQ